MLRILSLSMTNHSLKALRRVEVPGLDEHGDGQRYSRLFV
jgi:hypothetical protein